MDLTFKSLREANIIRDREWDPRGKLDMEFRIKEFVGEVGEFFNVLKKLQREDLGLKGSRATLTDLHNEAADIQITFDLMLMELGIDTAEVTRSKFNETSVKHNFDTMI